MLLRKASLKIKQDKLELGLCAARSGEVSVCAGMKSPTLKSLAKGWG